MRQCWLAWVLALGGLVCSTPMWAAEVTQFRLERSEEGVYLSATLRFELSTVVQEALLKGVPLFFVWEADISRDRWYWTDRRVASASRTARLAFQPLTRRWRVNISDGPASNAPGLRATLNQNYDTLPEALAGIARVSRWKIAEATDVDPNAPGKVEFNFRLDLSQLPRPFQMGVAGQREWDISAQLKEPLKLSPAIAPPSTGPGAETAP